MADVSHAVFLIYASQDVEAAQRICAALRSAGVEVWFDQSELRGDAWVVTQTITTDGPQSETIPSLADCQSAQ